MSDDWNGPEQTFRDTERNLRNLIEAQAAEIERLREVLVDIAEYGDDPEHPAVLNIADKALAALENKP